MPLRGVQLLVVCAVLVAGCGSSSDKSGSDNPAPKPGEISSSGCNPGQTAAKYPSLKGRTIKVGTTTTSPPYRFIDPKNRGKIVGFDADFLAAWTKCLGIKYEWQPYQEVSAMIAAVQSGRSDLIQATLFLNPERAKQLDFVVYMKSFTGSLVKKGNPEKLESIDDLCGKKDAQALGVVEVPLMKEQSKKCKAAGKPPVKLDVFSDNNVAIQAVVTGRADSFLGDAVLLKSIAKKFPTRVQTAFTLDNNLQIGVGVSKKETELTQAALEGIKAIQANGTEKRLLQKWGLDEKQLVPANRPQ
jgi:polar amino acid transport system substrate-binding protein